MTIHGGESSQDGNTRRTWATVALALLCLFTVATSRAQAAVPQLSVDKDIATAGYFRLSWESDAPQVELNEATNPEFRNALTPYRGPDSATVISGKPNGIWYYRVRAVNDADPGPWSETLAVTVAHHSLSRALLFLALGVLVFVAVVVMIIRGPRQAE
jgi:hypothetical protein